MGRSPSFPRLAESGHYGRPFYTQPVDPAPHSEVRRPARRQLFYGSSATSNQRLIIQRGNVRRRFTTERHATHVGGVDEDVRRGWASRAAQIDAVDEVSAEHHTI